MTPDWWTIKRYAETPLLGVMAVAPVSVGTFLTSARGYFGLSDAQLGALISSKPSREAFYLFLAAAVSWVVAIIATFVLTPRPLRGHSSREAAIESFKKATGLSLTDGVMITQVKLIDLAATDRPIARSFIPLAMLVAFAAFLAGTSWLGRALLQLLG